jgi:membrane protein implicated in regulation of membrane protease activity
MKIAKPILLVSTPIGVIWGVVVAWQIHPWLAWLMMALLSVVSVFIGYTVYVVRREQRTQASIDSQKLIQ